MDPRDAKLVLTKLFGAYRASADQATVLVYSEALAPFSREVGLAAVDHLIRTTDRLPSVARLLEALRMEARRQGETERELPPGPPINWREAGLEGIAKARAELRKAPEPPRLTDPEDELAHAS